MLNISKNLRRAITSYVYSVIVSMITLYLLRHTWDVSAIILVVLLQLVIAVAATCLNNHRSTIGIALFILGLIVTITAIFFVAGQMDLGRAYFIACLFGNNVSVLYSHVLLIMVIYCLVFGVLLYYSVAVAANPILILLVSFFPILLAKRLTTDIPSIHMGVLVIAFCMTVHEAYTENDKKPVNSVGGLLARLSTYILISGIAFLIPINYSAPLDNLLNALLPIGASRVQSDESSASSPATITDNNPDEIVMYVYSDSRLYLACQTFQHYDTSMMRWLAQDSIYRVPLMEGADGGGYRAEDARYSLETDIRRYLKDHPELLDSYGIDMPQGEEPIVQKKDITLVPRSAITLIPHPEHTIQISPRGKLTREIVSVERDSLIVSPAYGGAGVDITYNRYLPESYSNDNGNSILRMDSKDYDSLMDQLQKEYGTTAYIIDYMASKTKVTESNTYIKELAQDLTRDCDDDYEKAIAIRNYFIEEGFVYDDADRLSDKGTEAFLQTEKRGNCVDYATAMTRMLQELGVSARYTEGYLVQEYDESRGMYVVRKANGHAFVEVYLQGVGWQIFDPTVAEDIDGTVEEAAKKDYTFYIIITVLLVIVVLCIILLALYVRFGIYINIAAAKRKEPDDSIVYCYNYVWKKLSKRTGIGVQNSDVLVRGIMDTFGLDIHKLAEVYDYVVYGNGHATQEDREQAIELIKAIKVAERQKVTK